MNLVAFGLILICCHAWAIEINGNLFGGLFSKRTKFEEFLENLKPVIRNGNNSLGLPPLDPFISPEQSLNIHELGINLDGNLKNVKVDGLSSYKVNYADFKIFGLKVQMSLTWPLVVTRTNYSVKGDAFGFDVFGTGDIQASVHDFTFSIKISLTLKKQHVQINEVSTSISLGVLDFKIMGLYDDEEMSKVMSGMISDMAPKIIKENQELLDNVNFILKKKGNEILSKMTLNELLKIIGL